MRHASQQKVSGTAKLCFGCALALMLAAAFVAPALNASAQNETRKRSVVAATVPPQQNQETQPQKTKPTAGEEQSPGGDTDDDEDVVRVSTSEVLLPVTVRDAEGRLVTNLTRESFRVWEDGREQPLSDLALRRVPVDVMLMVDSSSSVAQNFEDFRRAVGEFAVSLSPDDRVSLMKFDDRVELLLDWTKSRPQLRRSLSRLTPGMFTRFHDALYLAAREGFKPGANRHAVVVLTDGIDSGRGYASLEMSLRALLEAQAAVYVISNTEIERARKKSELDTLLASPPSVQRFNQLRLGDLRESLRVLDLSETNLAQLTGATGGRLYKPESFDALDSVYKEVAEELRHQYALYYTPHNKSRDGKFRRVRVETAKPEMRVTTRVGYFGPREKR